jgi:hypothetical protein
LQAARRLDRAAVIFFQSQNSCEKLGQDRRLDAAAAMPLFAAVND